MIIDQDLPVGLIANTSAALGISLASGIDGLSGKKLTDADGRVHAGVTRIPIPILALSKAELKLRYDDLLQNADEELTLIGFNDVAQRCMKYEDYEKQLAAAGKDEINYLGFCVYGPKKAVNKLTGSIKMLK